MTSNGFPKSILSNLVINVYPGAEYSSKLGLSIIPTIVYSFVFSISIFSFSSILYGLFCSKLSPSSVRFPMSNVILSPIFQFCPPLVRTCSGIIISFSFLGRLPSFNITPLFFNDISSKLSIYTYGL